MAAALLYLPANRAFNSNGLGVPGAVAKLYTTGTLTPQNFYSNSGLSVSLGSSITANAAGRFAAAYQDETVPFRLRVEDSLGAELDDIDPYYFGTLVGTVVGTEGAVAASRTELATLSGVAGASAILTESGREGQFAWSAANNSANVTADGNQGVYVAPVTDVTGASGAWVRKFAGPHNVKWFGATGDGTTNDGAAVLAAVAHLTATAQSGFGYSSGAPELLFPFGEYYLGTNTIDLTATMVLTGEGTGGAGGGSSVLRWAAAATGIRVQRSNTSGATAATGTGVGGDGSIIRNLLLKGGFASAEGEYHGVHLRAVATIEDCFIDNFQGDGIYAKATIGGGAGSEGACNLIQVNRVFVQNCRNGIYLEGADANAGNIASFSAIACRQWGVFDKSFLGNTFVAPHVAANARNATNNGTTLACSFVTQGGNRYTVIRGQETGASTNAPTGAATNNTWWIYVEAGGATTGVPAWVSGITVRSGGGYLAEGLSQTSSFVHPYAEIDQYSQFDQNTGILGNGFLQGHIKVSAGVASVNRLASMGASINGFRFNGNLEVIGDANLKSQNNFIGLSTGTAADSVLTLDCSNSSSDIVGNVAGVEKGRIKFLGAINGMDIKANAVIRLFIGGTQVSAIGATDYSPTTDNAIDLGLTGTRWKALYAYSGSFNGSLTSKHATAGLGYATGAGGAVTQITSRTTGVTLNAVCGAITLFSAAGSTTAASFTVTNSAVAATDTIIVCQKSGTDKYNVRVSAVGAGSFEITFATISGTTTEQPVFNFSVIKAVAA